MTKSTQIANDIRDQILVSKELLPNQMMGTEAELCKQYGVSKMTLKAALDILVDEGLIHKKRGVGTFVKNISDVPMTHLSSSSYLQNLHGFSRSHKGSSVGTKVLEYTVVPAEADIAEKLNIQPGDFVYRIIRVRSLGGEPTVHEETYMPIDIIPGLKRSHVEVSIYGYIENELNKTIQSSHVIIRVKSCPDDMAAHLNLAKGEPIAQVTQIAFLDDGQIFEYSISSHRHDKFEFHNVMVKRNI